MTSAHGCQLVINDYWREAIDLGAGFVHLGQGDLVGADIAAIKAAGIRIGISTHSIAELDIALGVDPDYVALGPIYPTKLKAMPWAPQGSGPHRANGDRRSSCPLVAIGGITLERAPDVLAAGASSAAVVTDIVMSDDPEAAHAGVDRRNRPLAGLIHRLSTILTPLTEGGLFWNIVGHAFGRRGLNGPGLQS